MWPSQPQEGHWQKYDCLGGDCCQECACSEWETGGKVRVEAVSASILTVKRQLRHGVYF